MKGSLWACIPRTCISLAPGQVDKAAWARKGDPAHFTSYGEPSMNHLVEPKNRLQNPEEVVTMSWLTYVDLLTRGSAYAIINVNPCY